MDTRSGNGMTADAPFELPDDQCERLKRHEMGAVQMLMTSLSNLRHAQPELADRMRTVPDGERRMQELIDTYAALFRDLCGTISDRQRRHLSGICQDMEVRLVPKMTAKRASLVLTPEEGRELVDAAQAKCMDCFRENEESKGCRLRALLEIAVPLESYDTMDCPYSRSEWEDREGR